MAEYKVTYKDKQGILHAETRDTVERAFYLYESYRKDEHKTSVELFEVGKDMEIRLRPTDDSWYAKALEEEKKRKLEGETNVEKVHNKNQTFFETMFGCTEEEYMDAVSDFAKWHGCTLADWGLDDK